MMIVIIMSFFFLTGDLSFASTKTSDWFFDITDHYIRASDLNTLKEELNQRQITDLNQLSSRELSEIYLAHNSKKSTKTWFFSLLNQSIRENQNLEKNEKTKLIKELFVYTGQENPTEEYPLKGYTGIDNPKDWSGGCLIL